MWREFWLEGYFVSKVSAQGTKEMIKNYVKAQGKLDEGAHLRLF
jgi:REP element-mobilizing transposase RayT